MIAIDAMIAWRLIVTLVVLPELTETPLPLGPRAIPEDSSEPKLQLDPMADDVVQLLPAPTMPLYVSSSN